MTTHRPLIDSERIKCQFFLQNHPLFANLKHNILVELSKLFVMYEFVTDDIIVAEDENVDSIFFIASGSAMVGRSFSRISSIYIAELSSGHAIGLSDTGLFSKTMKRTATVVAKSDVKVFRLDLKKFDEFLKQQPDSYDIIHANSDLFVRIKFINEIIDLKGLSLRSSLNLVEKVEEITIPADQLLEQNGDWYLLQSGKIEVLLKESENTGSQIAILTSPALLLENITHKPNIIVKTLMTCKFLKISEQLVIGATEEAKLPDITSKELFKYTKDGWIAF